MSRPTTLHVVKPEPKRKAPSLLDPDFKYVHSTKSDIRKTFARIRREQAQAGRK